MHTFFPPDLRKKKRGGGVNCMARICLTNPGLCEIELIICHSGCIRRRMEMFLQMWRFLFSARWGCGSSSKPWKSVERGDWASCMGRTKSHLKTCLSRQLQKSHQGMWHLTAGGAAAIITACRSLLGNAVQLPAGTFLSKTQKLLPMCKTGDQGSGAVQGTESTCS